MSFQEAYVIVCCVTVCCCESTPQFPCRKNKNKNLLTSRKFKHAGHIVQSKALLFALCHGKFQLKSRISYCVSPSTSFLWRRRPMFCSQALITFELSLCSSMIIEPWSSRVFITKKSRVRRSNLSVWLFKYCPGKCVYPRVYLLQYPEWSVGQSQSHGWPNQISLSIYSISMYAIVWQNSWNEFTKICFEN